MFFLKLKDLHNHTEFSFDSEAKLDDLCKAAINRGLDAIAVTNHLDLDCIRKGMYDPYDGVSDSADIFRAAEKYNGDIRVIRGLEFGQPVSYSDEFEDIKKEYGIELVLGSIHNLKDCPDFYYFDFKLMEERQIKYWFERYLDEILQMVSEVKIDILTHLGYPIRYMRRNGKNIDPMLFSDKYLQIFKKIIEKGIALEVNVSDLKNGMDHESMPSDRIIRLYRECGGRAVSVGSDSHIASYCGIGIAETYDKLKKIGFEQINEF